MNEAIWNNVGVMSVAVLVAMVVASFLVRQVTNRLRAKHDTMSSKWSGAVWNSVRWPMHLLIWLSGWKWLVGAWIHYISPTGAATWDAAQGKLSSLIIILVVTVFVIALLHNLERWLAAYEAETNHARADGIQSITRVARIVTVVVALFAMTDAIGYDVSNLLVAGGVGGIVLGFAAKDMLSNIFGTLSVYLDRPFNVGDVIEVPDKNILGRVEQMSLRLTKMRNFDRQQIFVPNGVFSQNILINRTRMTHRRLDEFIGVRYSDIHVVESIAKEIQQMLDEHPDIDSQQSRLCYLSRFGASSVDIRVYVFTSATDWEDFHRAKQDILMRAARIIEKHGAEIAFPTQTLHVNLQTDESENNKQAARDE